MRRAGWLAATAGLAMLAADAVQAADVSGCVDIDDPAARLACYDAAAGRRPSASSAAPAVTAAPAAAPAAPADSTARGAGSAVPVAGATAAAGTAAAAAAAVPAPSAEQAFGLSPEKLVARENTAVDELRARISAVANHPRPGRWVVTLDNGQVWEQREAGAESRRPRPGDEVTVRKAALGSFLMVVPGRGTFRVARIK